MNNIALEELYSYIYRIYPYDAELVCFVLFGFFVYKKKKKTSEKFIEMYDAFERVRKMEISRKLCFFGRFGRILSQRMEIFRLSQFEIDSIQFIIRD